MKPITSPLIALENRPTTKTTHGQPTRPAVSYQQQVSGRQEAAHATAAASHEAAAREVVTRGSLTGPWVPAPPPPPARLPASAFAAPAMVQPEVSLDPVRSHPLALTVSSRSIEKPLAEVAAVHAGAAQAAQLTLARAHHFMQFTVDHCPPAAKIFGSFTNEVARTGPRFNQTGDIDPSQVEEAMEQGNIREHMCMLGNSQPIMARAMYAAAERAAGDPAYAAAVTHETGVDMAALVTRFHAVKAAGMPPEKFLHALEGTESVKQPAMRRSSLGPREAGRYSDFPFSPPLSARERAHLNAWRADQEAQGIAVSTRLDSLGNESFRLPQQDGKTLFRPRADHAWHQQSNDRGMSTRVSISGTTYRLIHMAQLLGATPEQAEDFRTALLGHVTPYHHTYHEVMSASAELGLPYEPGVQGMRAHARAILGDAGVGEEEPGRALLKKLSSVRRYEDAEG